MRLALRYTCVEGLRHILNRALPELSFRLFVMYYQGFIGWGGGVGGSFPLPKEGRREGRREREMWSLREATLFVGGIREREEKIIEERQRRNAMLHV